MSKVWMPLVCTVAIGLPAFAEEIEDSDPAVWEGDVAQYVTEHEATEVQADAQQDDLLQTIQWGGRGRVWTCFARSRRSGRVFTGQSRNANTARRIALNRCWNVSSGCFNSSCR